MLNHMTWETNGFESFLEVEVKLNLTLEVVIIPLRNCDNFLDCGICRLIFSLKKEKHVKRVFLLLLWGKARGSHMLHEEQLIHLRPIFEALLDHILSC